MPQMAPLNWLSLLVYFIMIFMTLNSFNFYMFLYQQNPNKLTPKFKTKINWKCL
uniref:ATP synthase complex subunit 8 n=1 Tax=Hycleus marcipoli TaxID=1914940 RepID=A0A343A7C7_9CUCU|nr:ATP synthase F0 subunit 8 [Hycleus marcipoli]APB02781.1 ATP synthase F0 subunit 8 [Hycleus marcipoli]